MTKIPVGILGATGMVGQHFIRLLANHPWFEITALAASERSVGKPYAEACSWVVSGEMPASVRDIVVQECKPDLPCRLVFSALPASVAGPVEEEFAAAGYVVSSNARSHRLDPDVPLLVPEVNPDHLALIEEQRRRRGWEGFIVTNPNCSTIILTLALKPLFDRFGLEAVSVVTMQALSGAGYPGVPSLRILDNVIPYIAGEEEKIETETLKILGQVVSGKRQEARGKGQGARGKRQEANCNLPLATCNLQLATRPPAISAQCHRVATRDGHLEAVSVKLGRKASLEEVVEALRDFQGLPQELGLPTAPERPIIVREEPDRPQPFFDRDAGDGMSIVVGRVRECPVLDYKFVVLGHNVVRGAAGAAILNAELLKARGLLD